jgi:hypothetical protein
MRRVNYEMTLKEEWDRLDSKTRQWLLNNPGCVMVPRTVAATIKRHSAGHIEVDVHGQMILSREDLDFIRDKGAGGETELVSEEFRLFDAAQPGERT